MNRKQRPKKQERIVVKVTIQQKKKILNMADAETEGNVSRLVLSRVLGDKRS